MLTMNNQSNYIRKEISVKLLEYFFNGTLKENIDRIPIDLNPKNKDNYRCCTYKDRAMTRYRIMALLGMSIEYDNDEYKPLHAYLDDALNRKRINRPVMTVIDTACSACPRVTYRVTDSCRGCLARPCSTNCPFDAIVFVNGRAVIDKDRCKNCGKCRELCPFHAIIYTPVPCEESCPVDAISRDENGAMCIDYDKCISCGRCSRSCPFGAVMERSQVIDVADILKSGRPAAAMIAPSVAGQFPGSLNQLIAAVKALGFTAVLDVASGAEQTAEDEAREFTELVAGVCDADSLKPDCGNRPLLATSCCPAWVEAAEKHIAGMDGFISETKTPMHYTSIQAAELAPDAVRVFIGPCTAKKNEALRDNSADYVLSFEELGALLIARGIDVNDCAEENFDNDFGSFRARAFAASGGVAEAVAARLDPGVRQLCSPLAVNGLSKKNIRLLKTAAAGKLKHNMIEVMSCEGGCICGPGVISNPKIAAKKLDEFSRETA